MYQELLRLIPFVPKLDICTDNIGSNSLCTRFITCKENSLTRNLEGEKIVCNPPFKVTKEFVDWLEVNQGRDPTTKALIVMPLRHGDYDEWFPDFLKRNRWRLIWIFNPGTKLFSGAPKDLKHIHDPTKRIKYWGGTREPVLIFVFNDEDYPDYKDYRTEDVFKIMTAKAPKVPGIGPPQKCYKCGKYEKHNNNARHEETCKGKNPPKWKRADKECDRCGMIICGASFAKHRFRSHGILSKKK